MRTKRFLASLIALLMLFTLLPAAALAEEPAPEETLPDGYVRRSPVQPYGPDPKGKRKVLTAVLILCLLAVLLAAAGLLYLRYFRR